MKTLIAAAALLGLVGVALAGSEPAPASPSSCHSTVVSRHRERVADRAERRADRLHDRADRLSCHGKKDCHAR
jgi:hypothetical protein